MPSVPGKRPCEYPGCRAWARRHAEAPYCASHLHLVAAAGPDHPGSDLPRPGATLGDQNRLWHGFYNRPSAPATPSSPRPWTPSSTTSPPNGASTCDLTAGSPGRPRTNRQRPHPPTIEPRKKNPPGGWEPYDQKPVSPHQLAATCAAGAWHPAPLWQRLGWMYGPLPPQSPDHDQGGVVLGRCRCTGLPDQV
jgi:hypothetical protein